MAKTHSRSNLTSRTSTLSPLSIFFGATWSRALVHSSDKCHFPNCVEMSFGEVSLGDYRLANVGGGYKRKSLLVSSLRVAYLGETGAETLGGEACVIIGDVG